MSRPFYFALFLTAQLIISSCTGYGLVYDDPHFDITDDERACLQQATSTCLLDSAMAITDSMSDKLAQAEALTVLSRANFELGNDEAAIDAISKMAFPPLQYSNLIEISRLAKELDRDSDRLLHYADTITLNIQKPEDKIPALLLRVVLAIENEKPDAAKQQLTDAIHFIEGTSTEHRQSLDLAFFKILLPVLIKIEVFSEVDRLIALQTHAAVQFEIRVDYAIQLKTIEQQLAAKHYESIIKQAQVLDTTADKADQLSNQNALIKLLINFGQLEQAKQILQRQTTVVSRAFVHSIMIQQLALSGDLDPAKQQLVALLRDIRGRPVIAINDRSQQTAQDDFQLDNLRAQAIANVALALAQADKLSEAVHLAEQIQVLMAHIQGYTLSKLALFYARQGDFNTALLTMESIYRPINRAASLAQISALVAETGDLSRAIVIASRINRQSWRDIAFSEISIAQAKQNDITAAMKTLESIQRSYSSVYAMAEIARTFKATQNKR